MSDRASLEAKLAAARELERRGVTAGERDAAMRAVRRLGARLAAIPKQVISSFPQFRGHVVIVYGDEAVWEVVPDERGVTPD